MKLNPGLFLVFAFSTLSCSRQPGFELTGKNFEDEIQVQQNLVFEFSGDMVPDSVINLWDSSAYMTFKPEVSGAFKWTSRNQLLFSPSSGFRPATTYTASWNEPLTRFLAGRTSGLPLEPLTFRTPGLNITAHHSWWSISPDDPGLVLLNLSLQFNYPVNPATLASLTGLTVNGSQVSFRPANNTPSETVILQTDPLPETVARGCTVNYAIRPGARCEPCTEPTMAELTGMIEVTAPGKLEITHVEGMADDGRGVIRVYCNQQVNLSQAAKHIRIEPELPFTLEHDGNGFMINGAFEPGTSYRLMISKQLTGAFGGSLEQEYQAWVPFGEPDPSISFVSARGTYLSSGSSRKTAVRIINVPKVAVRVFKIYENNIQAFMRYHRYGNYYDEEEGSNGGSWSYSDYNIGGLGDVIMEQEYDSDDLPKHSGASVLSLDFTEQGQFRGIYLVTVASSKDRWIRANKIISVSDIGLLARRTDDEIHVFANSLKTAMPEEGLKISFISTNNQVLHQAVTDHQGVAVWKGAGSRFRDFTTGMITARGVKDFNFMILEDSRVEDSRFDVGGKTTNPAGLEVFVYGDRELYRPGDTVYFNALLRDDNLRPVGEFPVKVRLLMPNGREYEKMKRITSSSGAATGSFSIAMGSVTGTWNLELYSANDILLASKNISVEEFMPDRVRVETSADRSDYRTGDTVHCAVTAMNLFGTPASDRNFEMEFSLRRKNITSGAFPDHDFSVSGTDQITFNTLLQEGRTGEKGTASAAFAIPAAYTGSGLLEGRVYTTVFDETGRPVNRLLQFDVGTQERYFGLQVSDYYNTVNQPVRISMAATDMKGAATGSPGARLEVIRISYETVMERTYGSGYRYVSQRKEHIAVSKTLRIEKTGSFFTFTPQESGQYLVRIREGNTVSYVQCEFYAYGRGYTQNSSFEVNNEGRVEMEFDKEAYQPGDKARILLKAPFAGRVLVTVERNKVFEYFYIRTDKRSAELEIPVKEAYVPNAYITATLFRPLDDGAIPVTIAHGFAPFRVERPSGKLPVAISAPLNSRSNTTQMITVRSAPGTELTVAVVDEGILQLKNTQTPDPHGFFFQKRALEVDAFDIYPFVLPDIVMRGSSPAGDGYDLRKRVNPMAGKRVKPIALWSGILRTDGQGEARFPVRIPQFSGDLRIMAAAWKQSSFGSDEAHIKVADPVVISPSLPRFLTPGDTLLMPVTLTNTTGNRQQVTVDIGLKGPLMPAGTNKQTVTLEAGREQRAVFRLAAAKTTGTATVSIRAATGSEFFTDHTEITVRPAASLQKRSGSGTVDGGSSVQADLKTPFIPASRETKLLVSRSPVVPFSDQMDYLLGYPHGCIEQTISSAFPQLYYADLARHLTTKPGHAVQVSVNITAAIRKIQSMQQHNGAITYWPGGSEENWWGSAYAYHFLNEAKKAGYETNGEVTEKLRSYLGSKVRKHPTESYRYTDARGDQVTRTIPAKDIFYSLYLMALYAKADIATMNYYRSRVHELALDSKYLLAVSYLACGERKAYNELLPRMFEGEKSLRSPGGNFYSYIRDEALALNALLEADPGNPQTGTMLKRLSEALRSEKYLSTQERAFAFLAIGKYAKQAAASTATATVTQDGKLLGTAGDKDLVIRGGMNDGKVTIRSEGAGKIYYFWETEGLTADGSFREEDSFLKVRRTYLSRTGKPVADLKNIRRNELIVVKITLENTARNKLENIVVSDILPACLEIENPRISSVPELAWIRDMSEPDHTDIRDDRIHYYTSADEKPRNFYYLARAVSTGTFILGPVSADAMYDGTYHSYHGAGVMVVN